MAVQEHRHGAVLDEFDVHVPAKAQNHHETVESLLATVGPDDLEVAEVHLGLPAWMGLEPQVGHPGALLLDGAHEALDCLVAAPEALLDRQLPNPGALVVVLAEPVLDHPVVGRQAGLAVDDAVTGESFCFQVLGDGVAVEPQLPGDAPIREALLLK